MSAADAERIRQCRDRKSTAIADLLREHKATAATARLITDQKDRDTVAAVAGERSPSPITWAYVVRKLGANS